MKTRTEIRTVNGVSRLFVNGKPLAGITYHNRHTDLVPYMKQFADSGTKLFFSHYNRNWAESWDAHFERVASKMDAILAMGDDIYLIMGFFLSASRKWAEANPDELCRKNGKPMFDGVPLIAAGLSGASDTRTAAYSFTSEKFDEVVKEHVNRSLDFLETYHAADRVIGIFASGGSTQEWNPFSPDYGPTALKAYEKYLRGKYRTVAALRKAWKDRNVSFEKLSVPTEAEMKSTDTGDYFVPGEKGQKVIDWRMAMAVAKGDRIINSGRTVKERRPDLIAGCFHGDLYREPDINRRILKGNEIDYLVSPPQYHARCPGQHMALNQMVDSFHAHGKLYFSEEDLRPHDWPCRNYLKARKLRLPYQGDASSVDDTVAVYEKGLGLTTAKGTMAWYFHFFYEFFGREKRYFQMNRRMLDISMLNIRKKCRSNAEVLVVSDESSSTYFRKGSRLVQKQVDRELTFEFGYAGVPHDVMFTNTLDSRNVDFSRYKLVFFLNSHMADSKQRRLINRLKSDGRTLVFGHGAGFLDETGCGVDRMRGLIGIDFEQLDVNCAPTVTMVDTSAPVRDHLPAGYTFGQSYRAMRFRADNKGNPLFPPPVNVSPLFAVADKKSLDLGFYNLEMPPDYVAAAGTKGSESYELAGFKNWPRYFVGMAMKEFKNWSSVYIGTPVIPTALIRALCKHAGVHVYVETEDIVYCNNRFLVLHTGDLAGERVLNLPRKTDVHDLKTGKRIASRTRQVKLDCAPRRTWLLWLGNRAE